MARKRYTVEQIIAKLREAEIELAQGAKTPQACRKRGISENTYYRRLKELERENGRLKKLLAETMLDNAILREVSSGNF
jgi:putative transposase